MIERDEFGPETILEVYDPKTGMKGFTVLFNTVLGPGKGGIRMTPTVSREEVFRLARAMCWKCALADLPFGGGKSGIVADAKKLSPEKKEAIVKAFAKAIKPICPSKYVAAPDISMAEDEMGWFVEANGDKKSVTGKPKDMGGIPHELGSTGFGVAHATKVAIEHMGFDIAKTTVAIEGFGNVGTFTMKFLSEWGVKIVAVSDTKGTIYNPDGLDYAKLAKVKKEQKTVTKYSDGKVLSNGDLFELPVDVLVPGALPDVITDKNFNNIKAKIIVEAANIPMSYETEKKFHKKGVMIVPDFVANAGGVISSYVEWKGGTVEEMWKLVEEKIVKNTKEVLERAKKNGMDERTTALEIAKERIKKKRGW